MQYYSTSNASIKADFRHATVEGQAPDRGLYFPSQIPVLPKQFIDNINSLSKEEIALKVIEPYVSDSIPPAELNRIVDETIAFDFP
jgi:threonine synthase